MPQWTYLLKRTLTQHIGATEAKKLDGWRPVSISMHGPIDDLSNPLYSSIWVQKLGTKWEVKHLLNKWEAKSYLNKKREETLTGYNLRMWPRTIAAWGPSYDARFAVIMEGGGAESEVDLDILLSTMPYELDKRRKDGWFPRSIATYGRPTVIGDDTIPAWCAVVWEKQRADRLVYFNGFQVPKDDVSHVSKALRAGFARVDHACIIEWSGGGAAQEYYLLSRGDTIPGARVKHDLTEGQVHAAMEELEASGKWPLRIAAAGELSWEAFSLTYADYPHYKEPERKWAISRPPKPAGTPKLWHWNQFFPIDDAFKSFMQANSIRSGQVAIAYKGRLIYTAGYTWAPATYPKTTPTMRFRVGSISKCVTALATCQLWGNGVLYADSTSYNNSLESLLNRKFKDPRFKERNVGQCLSHLARFNEKKVLDATVPSNLGVEVADFPITRSQVVDWIAENMDDAFSTDDAPQPGPQPGTGDLPDAVYDGVGFTMLAEICFEHYRDNHPDLEDALQENLFARVGVPKTQASIHVSSSATASAIAHDGLEAIAHPKVSTYAPSAQASGGYGPNRHAPIAYEATSGDVFLGNGAWALSCAAWARVLSAFDAQPNPLFDNPAIPGLILTDQAAGWYRGFVHNFFQANSMGTASIDAMWHNGGLPGGSAFGFRRSDGVTIVAAYNCDIAGSLTDNVVNTLVNALPSWPSWDLFPSVGIGS